MSENIIEVNEATFDAEVKGASGFVLVDFWAAWCTPCLMVAPVLEKIAEANAGKLKVCKVNVDNNQKLASGFGIMSIPTLAVFKDGREQERILGALGEKDLMKRLEKYLG